ncbi:alpha/beta hydrolase [Corynebacteriaceae bacterium 6-324]
MADKAVKVIFVPGAWMGGWIWEPTVERLRARGIDAETITLCGLEPGREDSEIAQVHLEDHVQQLIERIEHASRCPVVLVSHSYSGVVAALAADRLRSQVVGVIHVGSFLPVDSRAMLDDWGSSEKERAQERADIEDAGHLWLAPTRDMLDFVEDLTDDDRDFLASKFTAHPGRTVLDVAHLSAPVEEQPATYIALSLESGFDTAWDDAPEIAKLAATWRRRSLVSGHWPMVTAYDEMVDLLEAEIRHYKRLTKT